MLGVIGRQSGEVRLRVVMDTKASTLEEHVHSFTLPYCHVYTDEYNSYNGIERIRSTVAHGAKEWARDDDGDGIREVHTNTVEGMWTGIRNFLRPFRGESEQIGRDHSCHESPEYRGLYLARKYILLNSQTPMTKYSRVSTLRAMSSNVTSPAPAPRVSTLLSALVACVCGSKSKTP